MFESWRSGVLVAVVGLSLLNGLRAEDLPPVSEPAVLSAGSVPAAPSTTFEVPVQSPPTPEPVGDQVLVPDVAPEPTLPVSPPPAAPAKKKSPPQFPGPKTLPPTGPWMPLFFENDFSYAKDPSHDHLIGEDWKNVPFEFLDQDFKVSAGGEIRHRYMNEDNRLRPGGPKHLDYNLLRWRQYVDVQAGDIFRFYVEGINADSFGEQGFVQPIDVNHWDLQNYFVDANFLENDWGKHTFRYGRQELLFGRQRLISPLDWANTRRNFQGYHYILKGTDYKLDAFSVNPVNTATGFGNVAQYDNQFDQAHKGVQFSGVYFTYSGLQNTVLDAYWMYQNTQRDVPNRPDGSRHTIGSRVSRLFPVLDACGKEYRVWDFDTEGALQAGEDNTQAVLAGFYSAIAGHSWKQAPWTPRLSGLFYYGSGDRSPTDGYNNTFNVMYPLGHAYWAISDNLSGQNLYDYALQADVKPSRKSSITAAYHWFSLASNGDRAYNVGGVPVGTPGNGRNLGHALDLYGYYAFSPNFDVQTGYSWFWYGTFIDNTTPRGDATQFYLQTSFRY